MHFPTKTCFLPESKAVAEELEFNGHLFIERFRPGAYCLPDTGHIEEDAESAPRKITFAAGKGFRFVLNGKRSLTINRIFHIWHVRERQESRVLLVFDGQIPNWIGFDWQNHIRPFLDLEPSMWPFDVIKMAAGVARMGVPPVRDPQPFLTLAEYPAWGGSTSRQQSKR